MSNTAIINTTELNQIEIPLANSICVSNIVVSQKTYYENGMKYVDTKVTVYPGLPVDTTSSFYPKTQYIPLSFIGL